MQFRIIPAFIIFLGSYLPLALILAIQDIPSNWWARPLCNFTTISSCSFIPFAHPNLAFTFIGITLISIVVSNYSLHKINYDISITVHRVKSIPNDLINYVLPYIVSFMGVSYDSPEKLLGFVVFVLWMFAITYKSGQIIMNPILLIFGWKLYETEVTVSTDNIIKEYKVLKKGLLEPNKIYSAQKIQDFYIVEANDV